MDIKDFIDKNYIYAIVGATTNHEKYGYTVLMDLKSAGYNITPVNPKYEDIEGIRCYPDLASLPQKPDVVILVVPATVGLEIIKQCADLGIKKIWFQPGAESEEAVNLAKEKGIEAMAGACIMIKRRDLQ